MAITQNEAEKLFKMRKLAITQLAVAFPEEGNAVIIECESVDKRFTFQADINRKNSIGKKITLQNRHNKVYILRRLDVIGSAHPNPPGPAPLDILKGFEDKDIACPHVHIYVEEYNARWALPLSEIKGLKIGANDDPYIIMEKFFAYCNIENINFTRTLFS